jgi:hypothetical protein
MLPVTEREGQGFSDLVRAGRAEVGCFWNGRPVADPN